MSADAVVCSALTAARDLRRMYDWMKTFEVVMRQAPLGSALRTTPNAPRRSVMPRGDKSKYTNKQQRQAEHIEESYESRGTGSAEAKRRA